MAEGDGTTGGDRVAKLIARAGLCSRREAERLIEQGRVSVDGAALTTPAVTVDDPARIAVDGEPLPQPEPPRLFRLHKPTGVLTAERDPEGRRTIYDLLEPGLPRLMPVGRLDLNSEGLLLLTNDGALKRRLELPQTGWTRRYRVRVFGHPDADALAGLRNGITVEGVRYGPIEAQVDTTTASNAWLTVALKEGRNREVRKVMEHLGYRVSRLIRVAYGPFQLGSLKPGQVKEVAPKVLAEQLGIGATPAPKTGTAKPKPKPARGQTGKPSGPPKGGAKSGGGRSGTETRARPTRARPADKGSADPGQNKGGHRAHRRRTS
jgi:23S rRNA pseudouridine2605 synthase